MTPTLVVMAAGLGTRYGGFKQAENVGPSGELLLEYAAFDAHRAGFGRVVCVIGRELAEAFQDLARRLAPAIDVTSVVQDPHDLPGWVTPPSRHQPWGTTHAVLSARHVVHGPFAVVNADDFYGAASYDLAVRACVSAERTGAYAVIGLPLGQTLSPYGPVVRAICEVQDGWLTRLDEVGGIERTAAGIRGVVPHGARVLTGDEIASMNLWVFTATVFGQLQQRFDAFLRKHGHDLSAESRLPEAVNDLVASGEARVRVEETPGPWFGLTHAADRPQVVARLQQLVAAGVYPTPLWTPRPADTGRADADA